MKKIYALLLTLLLCLSMLSGCKDGQTVPGNRETTETDTTPAGTEAVPTVTEPSAPSGTTPEQTKSSSSEPPETTPPEAPSESTGPSDGGEPDDARGIEPGDTYDEAGILFREEVFYKDLFTLARGVIDGLLDGKVQDRINQALALEADAGYEACRASLPLINYVHMSSSASRAGNVLSVRTFIYGYNETGEYKAWSTQNYSLLDGKKLKLADLFTKGTKGEDIFRTEWRAEIPDGPTGLKDQKDTEPASADSLDIESLIPELIRRFDAREDIRFTFDGASFTVYPDVDGENVGLTFRFQNMAERVAVFQRFRADRELYTGEHPAVKNIPILVDRNDAVDGLFEMGEHYYFQVFVEAVPEGPGAFRTEVYTGADQAFYEYYEPKIAYLLSVIDEAEKEGKYILCEAWFSAFDDGKTRSVPGGGARYGAWGAYSAEMVVLDTKEEFEAAYERVLEGLRGERPEDAAHTTGGLYQLDRKRTGDLGDYELDAVHEDLYRFDYRPMRPFVKRRINKEKFKNKTPEEIMELLAGKEIEYPESIVKTGTEMEVTAMVLEELLRSPNRLFTRNWSFMDPVLVEVANRIADCIKE